MKEVFKKLCELCSENDITIIFNEHEYNWRSDTEISFKDSKLIIRDNKKFNEKMISLPFKCLPGTPIIGGYAK